jgi:hypothetical protein
MKEDRKAFARNADAVKSGDPSEELAGLTQRYMAEHNEGNFARALTSVVRLHPDLHREYLDHNREG